jgi:transcriptional regulator with XRE-family HTH domain
VTRSPHAPAYRKLRVALAAARSSAGLTQTDIAKRLKKPQSFVSKYETGERNLDVVEFLSVCRALGVEPATLLESLS